MPYHSILVSSGKKKVCPATKVSVSSTRGDKWSLWDRFDSHHTLPIAIQDDVPALAINCRHSATEVQCSGATVANLAGDRPGVETH